MRDDDEDEVAFEKYREQAKGLAAAFRRAPHNMIEEIEKIGFTYALDDGEDAEEMTEERVARPQTDPQITLVSYLYGESTPSEHLLKLWREEMRRADSLFPLWRRYFRTGNAQLRELILYGLDQYPTARDLLDDLSVLHSFVPTPKELLFRYTLACDLESDPERFYELAQEFEAGVASFGYDALDALRARHIDNAVKKQIIDGLFVERERYEEGIAF